jgi:hypothetical protein
LPIPLLLLLLLFPLAQGKTTDDLPPIFANRPKLKKPAAAAAAAATLKFSTLPGVHLLPLQVLNFAAGNSYSSYSSSSSSSSSWWVFFWVWLKGRPTDDILLSANKAKTKKACCCCSCNYCNATTTTTTTTVVLLTCSYKQANACDAIAAPTILAAQQNPFVMKLHPLVFIQSLFSQIWRYPKYMNSRKP